MIDGNRISSQSDLIDDPLKEQLQGVFARLKTPVVMKAVVDLGRDKDTELASFLKAISLLDDKLELELYSPEEAAGFVPELDITYLPATGLYKDGAYGRVSFHGIPAGKELNSLVLAMLNLSGSGKALDASLAQEIQSISKKTNIKICVSLACHHCPAVVAACQQIAVLNPLIEAQMIDAALYPDLVKEYKIERVPMMIWNDADIHMGSKTIEQIVKLLKK